MPGPSPPVVLWRRRNIPEPFPLKYSNLESTPFLRMSCVIALPTDSSGVRPGPPFPQTSNPALMIPSVMSLRCMGRPALCNTSSAASACERSRFGIGNPFRLMERDYRMDERMANAWFTRLRLERELPVERLIGIVGGYPGGVELGDAVFWQAEQVPQDVAVVFAETGRRHADVPRGARELPRGSFHLPGARIRVGVFDPRATRMQM